MKTHFSAEIDETAQHVETGSEVCLREHHAPKNAARTEFLVLAVVAALVALAVLLGPSLTQEAAESPAAHSLLTRAPVPHWRVDKIHATPWHDPDDALEEREARQVRR